jgi:Mg2+/citrate symporter
MYFYTYMIDSYSLKMNQRGSKHVAVEVLMFLFKIIYYSIVHFVGVFLCSQ